MGQDTVGCACDWAEGASPPDAPATKTEALARLKRLYETGTPFFTKEAIRAIYEQFQRPLALGDKVFVKDITGASVAFKVVTGNSLVCRDDDGRKYEAVFGKLAIRYWCRVHLMHGLWNYFERDEPRLLSLRISHETQARNLKTKEPIEDFVVPRSEVVVDDFQKHMQIWKESDMHSRLVQILESSAAKLDINKIVGVALGSITRLEESPNRSAVQHAFLLTMRDWLLKRKKEFPCYVQDPVYNAVDQSILGEHGVDIIDDPRAWLEIDEKSILFSCAPDMPVKEIVADIARPAVVIWERVTFRDYDKRDKGCLTDPSSPRVRVMMEEYELHETGSGEEWFTDIIVYVRKN